MITYRPLNIEDKEQLLEVFELNPVVYTKHTDTAFKNTFSKVLEEELANPLCFFPGIFVDNKLYSVVYFKEVVDAPAWILAHLMLRPSDFTTFIQPEYIDAAIKLDEAITNEMIVKRGLNRMYFVFPYDKISTLRSIGSIDRLYRYIQKVRQYESFFLKINLYTDCIIKANTMPRYTYQQKIIGGRTWPFDLAIRIGMVKSEV